MNQPTPKATTCCLKFLCGKQKMFFPEQLPLHLDQTLQYLCSRFSTNQQTTFQPFQTSLINHKQPRTIVVNHLTTINLTKQDLQNAYILLRFIFFILLIVFAAISLFKKKTKYDILLLYIILYIYCFIVEDKL